MHLQQTKRGSRRSGGPQYYFHDLGDAVKTYLRAVSQVGDPIWSMHKKKSNESVLAGELILTFLNSGKKTRVNRLNGFDVADAVEEVLSSVRSDKIYGEYLFNQIVMAAWQHGAIGSLDISKTEFVDLIQRKGWQYDEKDHVWTRHNRTGTLFPITK